MFDFPVIEVAIGLTFVFLVLSLCATAIIEGVVELRQWRGRLLHAKLKALLGSELVELFYLERRVADLSSGSASRRFEGWPAHSWGIFTSTSLHQATQLAKGMGAHRLPAYIPESVFADILLDWLQGIGLPGALHPDAPTSTIISDRLGELLQRMNRRADGSQAALRAELIDWFRQSTDRTSEEFKRRIRIALYLAGAVLVALTNADSIRISKTLYDNPRLRAEIGATAETIARACPNGSVDCPELNSFVRTALGRPIDQTAAGLLGWRAEDQEKFWSSFPSMLQSLLGWVITVMAIGLGADFWFGALKKLIAIKNPSRVAATDGGPTTLPAKEPKPDTPAPSNAPSREPLDLGASQVLGLKGFQPFRFAESNIHAFWLAQFASLAYSSVRDLEQSTLLKDHGLEVVGFEQGDTQAFLFKGKDLCIVAFRGTENKLEDWLSDADARQHASPWGDDGGLIKVHTGFHAALDLVWTELVQALVDVRAPIWFTGHSLGGALALLAAYRLHHYEKPLLHTVGGVYTFGQPRVGNSSLADTCSLEFTQRVFRYVNSTDLVPLVPPPRPIDYKHLGQPRYFDVAGRLHHERTLWERISEQLTPALQKVAAGDGDWVSVAKGHARQRVSDHGMARYLECLERIDAVRALWRTA